MAKDREFYPAWIDGTGDFNECQSTYDWIKLALAALDQAGCSAHFQRRLSRIVKAELWMEEIGEAEDHEEHDETDSPTD